jgi:hypothetical protein
VHNDEVQAILDGLQLDKAFFKSRLQPTLSVIVNPEEAKFENLPRNTGRRKTRAKTCAMGANGGWLDVNAINAGVASTPLGAERAKDRSQTGENAPTASSPSQAVAQSKSMDWKKKADFDIYLNETLVPVLAQSLDALCRQLVRNESYGDAFDPKQRERFNPLTWLGQQLLRRHPRFARTPRRQELYRDFAHWADCERGRREILRRKDIAQDAFESFATGAVHGVKKSSVPFVVADLDDKLQLKGSLRDSAYLQKALGEVGAWSGPDDSTFKKRETLKAENWPFEKFWEEFSKVVVNFDIITNSSIEDGVVRLRKQASDRREQVEAKQMVEDFKEELLEQERQITDEYTKLRRELMSDEFIRQVQDEQKILTGDDIRPGDLGFELEIPPHGRHCFLLARVLSLVGFASIDLTCMLEENEVWWTQELSSCWSQLQKVLHADLADGVVERGSLIDLLVEPDAFLTLRRRVEDELERLETSDDVFLTEKPGGDLHTISLKNDASEGKPTIEMLSQTLGLTVARLNWLHSLFEGFLASDDDHGPPPKCHYPEDPASLSKDQMKGILMELFPQTTDPEFEAHFMRIDEDGSGKVEFDEFVTWLAENQINLTGVSSRRMTFTELAAFHDVSEEIISYMHTSFQNMLYELEEPTVDGYPDFPAKLPKREVKMLIGILQPYMTGPLFESNWEVANVSVEDDSLDFSEFLEMLDFEDLPEEILRQTGDGSPKS